VAQYHHFPSADAIVVGTDQTPGGWRHRECLKVVAGHELAVDQLGLPVRDHVHLTRGVVGEDGREHRGGTVLEVFERWIREDAAHA
jgi:hypothetical protein